MSKIVKVFFTKQDKLQKLKILNMIKSHSSSALNFSDCNSDFSSNQFSSLTLALSAAEKSSVLTWFNHSLSPSAVKTATGKEEQEQELD